MLRPLIIVLIVVAAAFGFAGASVMVSNLGNMHAWGQH